MTSGETSPFMQAMLQPSNRGLGATTLLAWVAACDGDISERQHKLVSDFATALQGSDVLELAIQAAVDADINALRLSCVSVRNMPSKGKSTFLRWAFSVATENERLPNTTNYLLRFLADLINIDLAEAFHQADKTLPRPSDLSSLTWWNRREQHGKKKRGKKKKKGRMTEEEARTILGVDAKTDHDEIAKIFRRLAITHHPDRFINSSEEEQSSAVKEFARISTAFEILSQQ